MKKYYILMVSLIAVMTLCMSCGDDDDNENDGLGGGDNASVYLHNVPYTLKVRCDGSISQERSTDNEEISSVVPQFGTDDVAKPLVMHVTGKDVSGTLTLQDTDGTFNGTLQVPIDIADTLMLTGTIEIPASGGEQDDRSTVSLSDLIDKCGHRYTVNFKYKESQPVVPTDSKAYFEFIMSPCQRWLRVNNDRYYMNEDGKLWIAVESKTSIMTNFYKIPYNNVDGGMLYTIDRAGLVDLGIFNTLWADRNVGAENIWDGGDYYYWDEAQTCVDAPLEVPKGGETWFGDNDIDNLWDLYIVWGENNGSNGYYVVAKGCYDRTNDPSIFMPCAGIKIGGQLNSWGVYGLYWSSTELDSKNAYNLYFQKYYSTSDSYHDKLFGAMPVRAIRRGNVIENTSGGKEDEPLELMAFFPEDYPAEDVVAWYTSRDEEKMEEWSLYLFQDQTYLLTQYIAASDSRVLYRAGNYVIDGDGDPMYDNFAMVATVVQTKESVRFENGEGLFLDMTFHHENGDVPQAMEYTRSNLKVPVLYFPHDEYSVDDVAAWYRQVDAPNEFVVLYILKDNRYFLVNCKQKDEEIIGSVFVTGSFQPASGSTLDYRNMVVNVTINELGGSQRQIEFKDGFAGILDYRLEYQDVDILGQLVGN
jgi:hypothetical protein